MPLWEKLAQKISLFPEGVNGKEQPYSEKHMKLFGPMEDLKSNFLGEDILMVIILW
jgi:hypothetical protein